MSLIQIKLPFLKNNRVTEPGAKKHSGATYWRWRGEGVIAFLIAWLNPHELYQSP